MSSPAETPRYARRCATTALILVALGVELGCGASGEQVLGTIRPDDAPIRADGGGGGNDAVACSSLLSFEARKITSNLDIYFTIDRSGSFDPTGDSWDRLVSGLTQFLHDMAAGLGVGIGYFPVTTPDACNRCDPRDCGCLMAQCGCSCDQRGDPRPCPRVAQCDPASYDTPDVDIGPIPQNAGSVATSLFAQTPSGPTTVRPALRGALDYVANYTAAHPNDRVVTVLVAGGPPDTDICQPDTISVCADVAGSANTQTHVVAFDYFGPSLDPVAQRGGGRLFVFDSRRQGQDVAMQFSDLVGAISAESHCEYEIPSGADTNRITIQITSPASGSGSMIFEPAQVKSREACNGGQGWYFDRSDRPTRIIACDETCLKIDRTPQATVQIKICAPPPP